MILSHLKWEEVSFVQKRNGADIVDQILAFGGDNVDPIPSVDEKSS
jgi:hypothetical protein